MPNTPKQKEKKRLLCLICGKECYETEPPLKWCPNCGQSDSLPSDLDDSVDVKISWHELTILVMWAERWANAHKNDAPTMPTVIRTIADRLTAQHLGKPQLTLEGQVSELKAEYKDVRTKGIPGHEDTL